MASGELQLSVWTDRESGMTMAEIAAKYMISTVAVRRLIAERDEVLFGAEREAMRDRLTVGVSEALTVTRELMHAEPIPAYSAGKAILDERGRLVMDHSSRVTAAMAYLRASERMSKLMGLDAPTRTVNLDLTVQVNEATQAAANAALARLNGMPAPTPHSDPITSDIIRGEVETTHVLDPFADSELDDLWADDDE